MQGMKINIIREFLRLCETRNYTRTAEEMYISQSVLSRHISSLEEELGCQLINRSRTAFELTPAGEITKESFRKILLEYQDLLSQLTELSGNPGGELHAGVLYYDYTSYVEKIREVFRVHYPDIRLHLHSYQPAQIETDLLSGKLDAAILYSVSSLRREGITSSAFLKIPFSIMFDVSHKLASFEEIRVSDLDGERILWPSSHFELIQTDRKIKDMFVKNGIEIKEYIPFANFDDVPYLLKDTGSIYISPMANRAAYPPSVICRELEPEVYSTDISAVWHAGTHNPAVKALLNAIRITYP